MSSTSLERLDTINGRLLHNYLVELLEDTIDYKEYFKRNNKYHIKIDYYDWDKVEDFFDEDYHNEYRASEIGHDEELFDDYKVVFYMINYMEEEYVDSDSILNWIREKQYNCLFHVFAERYTYYELWHNYLENIKVEWLLRKKKRCKMDISLYNLVYVKQSNIPDELVEGDVYNNIISYLL